jgi:hypothetical protein
VTVLVIVAYSVIALLCLFLFSVCGLITKDEDYVVAALWPVTLVALLVAGVSTFGSWCRKRWFL